MELVGVLWEAATCLFGCGKVYADYVYNLKENLDSLKEKSNRLHNTHEDVLNKIEDVERTGEMKRTEEVDGWLKEVVRLQKEMESIEAQGSKEILNRCLNGCCPKNCVSSYNIGKKVVKILADGEALLTRGNHFDYDNIANKLPPKPVDEMPSIETVGLDLIVEKVWNSLEDQSVGIIGLYGMGGVGKTTLMMRIHNEFVKRVHNFDLVLWVVISREVDIDRIMDEIRKRLGVSDNSWNKYGHDQRVAKIYQLLKQKKFVLMLDDVWEKLELEKVGIPHTNGQSKVVLTTRMENVCDKMQAVRSFKVECLSEQEAFNLFCRNVGPQTINYYREIAEIAREIAQECKGLPLALITVGSAMAGVKSVEAWRQAKNDLTNSPWTAHDIENKVFSILKFSYDRLPDETHKICILYCALYPEDYKIEVDDLVERWIGEGFIGKDHISNNNIYSVYDQGKSIITKLKLSCLLENVEREFSWENPAIKMHDVIRDMALWIARDEDRKKEKVVVEGEALSMSKWDFERLNTVERISIINAKGSWQIPPCPNLLTLCVSSGINITNYSNLRCMTKIKVLDLSYDYKVEVVTGLAREINKLINLEFLKLEGFNMENTLPIEFKNLKNLKVLLMMDHGSGNSISIPNWECLESLEQLMVHRYQGVI